MQNNFNRTSKRSYRDCIESGFAWDRQDAYLFDIDGTLLRSRDRVHWTPLRERAAGDWVRGDAGGHRRWPGTPTRRFCARLASRPAFRRKCWKRRWRRFLKRWARASRSSAHELRPGPDAGRGRERCAIWLERGALLGVATGNLEMIGWIKVEQAGLREWFRLRRIQRSLPCPLRADWACRDKGARTGGRTCARLRGGRYTAGY